MASAQPRTPGIIDTIGAGYQALNRRLWLLSLPLLASLYLWYGTPIRMAPVLEDVNTWLTDLFVRFGAGGVVAADLLFRLQYLDLRRSPALPALLPVLPPDTVALTGPAWQLEAPLSVLAILLLFNGAGLVLAMLFRVGLASAIAGVPLRPVADVRRALLAAGNFCLSLAIIVVATLVVTLPFLVLSVLLLLAIPAAAAPIVLLWYLVAIAIYLYTGYALEALLLSTVGPLRAIYCSVAIVRHNLWPAIVLVLVSVLISRGLGLIWRQLTGNPAAVLLAMVGSAYIGGGLAAARLEFYRSRLQQWQARNVAAGRGAAADTSSGKKYDDRI